MKKTAFYLIFIVAFAVGCSLGKPSKESVPVIDVTTIYPQKEILLTDIADVSYLRLKSDNDDYLYSGGISSVSENTIIVHDFASGNILGFSREGIPRFHFNRKGEGPEEYISARKVIYDEKADDVFVLSFGHNNVFLVYSSAGEYKRKLVLPAGTFVNGFVSFDDESLFIYDASVEARKVMQDNADLSMEYLDYPFALISKNDGKVVDFAQIPGSDIILKDMISGAVGRTVRVIKNKEGVLLCNPETDTVFLYNKNRTLTPVICKIPSVSSLSPMVYLNNCADVGGYQFMETYIVRHEEGAFPFPVKYYMRDKETGEIFCPKITLPDYKGKEFFIQMGLGDYENGPYIELDLGELKQAYDQGRLSGKLKELVATLDEDEDNNIFMFVRFK